MALPDLELAVLPRDRAALRASRRCCSRDSADDIFGENAPLGSLDHHTHVSQKARSCLRRCSVRHPTRESASVRAPANVATFYFLYLR